MNVNAKAALLSICVPIAIGVASISASGAPEPTVLAPSLGCVNSLMDAAMTTFGVPPAQSGGYNLVPMRGISGGSLAAAVGTVPNHALYGFGPKDVAIWPQKFNATWTPDGNPCNPAVLGTIYYVLVHELLHFVCPEHVGESGAINCNNLNYAMNTAKAVCSQMKAVKDCLDDPDCPGILDDSGQVIPGLERENLDEFCDNLKDSYDKIQDKWNTPAGANEAFGCACGTPPWSPGASYPSCPDMPAPKGGCKGTAAETYPNDEVIPDCTDGC